MNELEVGALLKDLLLVTCGGLFGWVLSKLPEKWVYSIMALAILMLLVVLKVS